MGKYFLWFLALCGLLFQGCATTQLEVQSKMTRSISLSPSFLAEKKVALRVTGTEASVLELEEKLKKALLSRNIELVNEKEAKIFLHVNSLFANNLKEAQNYAASVGGGLVGGTLAKSMGNSSTDSILLGVGTALAMGLVQNAMADETYRAIVDVSLRTKGDMQEWGEEEKTRVIVQAVRVNLSVDEAKPIMEEKVVYQIAEILK